jgi:protein gp37
VAENSAIGWTDHTFNPWIGCQRVSQGCTHCYAETFTNNRMGRDVFGAKDKRQRTKTWGQPVKWNRAAEAAGEPAKVFCGSLCDVFEDAPIPNEARPELWALVKMTPWLDWLLLTKRPENIAAMLPEDWGDGYGNVWLGTSIEDARVGDRARTLAEIPAYRRFISYEPAIGPLFWEAFASYSDRIGVWPRGFNHFPEQEVSLDGIDWLIVGGESGPGHRPFDLHWARTALDRCADEEIAFFFKQAGGARPGTGVDALGAIYQAFPQSLPNNERITP